jgi:hypothetical protein
MSTMCLKFSVIHLLLEDIYMELNARTLSVVSKPTP